MAGCGPVGSSAACQLLLFGGNLTLIDSDLKKSEELKALLQQKFVVRQMRDHIVTIFPNDRNIEVETGGNLLTPFVENSIFLRSDCGGWGGEVSSRY